MKNNYLIHSLLIFFCVFAGIISAVAQVGVGTTAPRGALDIASTTQGFVLPTVSLAATNVETAVNPQGGVIPAGTVVYNDATSGAGATAVTPGMYYWDGSVWVSLTAPVATGTDWTILGNGGTNANTNFIGTTDNTDFRVRTNDTQRFNFTSNGRLRSYNNGNTGAPTYSWNNDSDTGMFRNGGDNLAFSSGGIKFLDFVEGGTDEAVFNDDGNDTNFRVESDNETAVVFVDGGDDEVGFFTDNPQNDVHIAGNNTGMRIDAFSNANNVANNGVDDAVLYVDTNGDLLIKPSLTQNQMPEDNSTTFTPAATPIISTDGSFQQATLYSTTFTLTQDALVEIVYQIGVALTNRLSDPIDDGQPRQYGTAVLINGTIVGYTSEAYTSNPDDVPNFRTVIISSGTFFLNGNGYAQLTGAPGGTNYTVDVIGFVAGGRVEFDFLPGTADAANSLGVIGEFGGNAGLDRFQLITHY